MTPVALYGAFALPFFLNDLLFAALDGGYGVYLADYATRLAVLIALLAWPAARAAVRAEPDAVLAIWRGAALVVLLVLAGRLLWLVVGDEVEALDEATALFEFGAIDDPVLNWIDLTFGLLLVAVTEELVFRRLALRALEQFGAGALATVVLSALVFALMHWGGGVGQVLYAFVIGALYMAFYRRVRVIWPFMAAHWIENFVAFGPF